MAAIVIVSDCGGSSFSQRNDEDFCFNDRFSTAQVILQLHIDRIIEVQV
jgi:hypothetical protein